MCARAVWMALPLLAITVIAGLAGAEELRIGVQTRTDYDTAAFSEGGKRVNAFQIGAGPKLSLARDHGRLQYDASYRGLLSYSPDENNRETYDQDARLEGSYGLSQQTRITVSDRFLRLESPQFVRQTDSLGNATTDENQRTQTRNRVALGLAQQFTPRLFGNLDASHSLNEFSANDRFDNEVLGASSSLGWVFTARDRGELGVRYSYQNIDGTRTQPGSRSNVAQIFARWTRALSEQLTLVLDGGPTIVESKPKQLSEQPQQYRVFLEPDTGIPGIVRYTYTDFSTCDAMGATALLSTCKSGALLVAEGSPAQAILEGLRSSTTTLRRSGDPADDTQDRLSFFGGVSLVGSYRDLEGSLGYRRTEAPTSGSGSTSSVDSVDALLSWRIDRWWQLRLRGSWSWRRSLTDVSVPVDLRVRGETVTFPGGGTIDLAENRAVILDNVSRAEDLTSWVASAVLSRRLGEHATASLEFRYQTQSSQGDATTFQSAERYLAIFRVDYDFDPLRF